MWRGRELKVAAYTEPSVFWERSNCGGVCRSWNYMASGEVLASLEDRDSQVDISTHAHQQQQQIAAQASSIVS